MPDRPYSTFTVTLTTANTNYNLYALCAAIDPACPRAAASLLIQSDSANAAAIVRLGDANLSDTRFGSKLANGDSKSYNSDRQNIPFGSMYARSDTNGSTLDIEVTTS